MQLLLSAISQRRRLERNIKEFGYRKVLGIKVPSWLTVEVVRPNLTKYQEYKLACDREASLLDTFDILTEILKKRVA